MSGEITLLGELYSAQGIEPRRASSLGSISFRPTLSLSNGLGISAEFLLSTDGSSARQSINQLGLNPTWKWGSAKVGDFSETYSPFSLGGVRVRGAALALHPGFFHISGIAGTTQ